MFNVKISLFARTRDLEHNIDSLHDKIIEMTMVFKEAVDIYLKERRSETYRRTSKKIKIIEHDSDTLRREIESKLYEQNLIPDLRGNILQLLKTSTGSLTFLTRSRTSFTLNSRIFLKYTISSCRSWFARLRTAPRIWRLRPERFSVIW